MKRNAGRVTPRAVASFLVQESKFPRSLRFCIHQADERLGNIRSPQDPVLPKLASHSRLRLLDAYLAGLPPGLDTDAALHELLTHVVEETAAICTLISEELLAVKPREVPPVQSQKQTQSGQSQTQA
jgi:uncharacterized alpha-E superfamily protein